mgnify:CR=1 FL=1
MTIHLKEKGKKESNDEKEWYEKAFGRKRNVMKYTLWYRSNNEFVKKGKFDFFAKIKYSMFPELYLEFDAGLY